MAWVAVLYLDNDGGQLVVDQCGDSKVQGWWLGQVRLAVVVIRVGGMEAAMALREKFIKQHGGL